MTIAEAVSRLDGLKPNAYDAATKRYWLSCLDGRIAREWLSTRATEAAAFTPYDADTPDDTALLAGAPYDEMYLHYLGAMVDLYNGEFDRYENAMAMFNQVMEAYTRRTHAESLPVQPNRVQLTAGASGGEE